MSLPGLELWMCLRREGTAPYTHMVWSVHNDEPHWFRNEDDAKAFIASYGKAEKREPAPPEVSALRKGTA